MNQKYTGRKIAVLTDIHALVEPLVAVLDDIKRRNIKEIYSLGDNIGVGPNPSEVLNLLNKNNVSCIMGNSEEYCILGIKPFSEYFNDSKIQSQLWTASKLTSKNIQDLKLYRHSIDLSIGGKKVALCHFANDVRIDFSIRSTWTYQEAYRQGNNPNLQFYYTNSDQQKELIDSKIKNISDYNQGYISAKNDPLFDGKKVDYYDEIIQGHVHFKMLTEDSKTKIRTIRALGMAYLQDPIDSASYIIIHEKEEGYDIEEILVPFNRSKMIDSILKSDMPNKDLISKFVLYKR